MRAISAVLSLAIAADALYAQSPVAALDSTFDRIRAMPRAPATAMAVVHRGRVLYTNVAGYADLERGVPAAAATRFDWASIAKQFTAHAVSLLVEDGKLRASDSVRRWLPELDLAGATITIDQLLHHTSGLEDGDGLLVLAGWRPGEPVTHADMARLLMRQQHLRFAPGTQHAYSNGGYSLLVEVIQRVTGRSFAAFTDSAIFGPLGMTRSGFVDGPDVMVPDRALPYVRRGGTSDYVPSSADLYPGAGGLFATVEDMARWAQHLLAPARDAAATLRLRERGRLRGGDSLDYAWGLVWGNYRGRATLAHGGSGPATSAQLLLIPALDFGVVAASAGDVPFDPSALAYRAADLVLGDALGPRVQAAGGRRMLMITDEMVRARPAESQGVVVRAGDIAAFAGNYRMPDSSVLAIRTRGSDLEFAYAGRPPWMPFHPLPGMRFVRVPWWEVFRFEDVRNGRARRMVVERTARSLRATGDSVQVAVRLPDLEFNEGQAAPYVGAFYSDELDALYEVNLRGKQLVLHHPRHGEMPLTALDSLRFAVDGRGIVGVRFLPGGDRMTGLELEARSWGVTTFFRRVELRPEVGGRKSNRQ